MRGLDHRLRSLGGAREARPLAAVVPCPGVPEPQRRQDVDRRGLGPAVRDGDANQDVLGRSFGVLDRDVEVPTFRKGSALQELELLLPPPAASVFLDEAGVGILALRVLVEPLHIGMGRCGIQIEVVLLDVLAMVALGTGEAEVALLEDRVAAVPERQREAEALMVVRDAQDAVLAPAIGARARVVVRKIVPGRAVGGVVLSHRPPLAVGEIGRPSQPLRRSHGRFLEPLLLHARVGRLRGLLSFHAVSAQARSTSATLQAWAGHPRGVKGASPSKISAMLPRVKSLRWCAMGASRARAAARSPYTRRCARAKGPRSHAQAGALVIDAVARGGPA